MNVDDVDLATYLCNSNAVNCSPGSRTGSNYGSDPNGQLTLSVNHSYLANSGSYADQTVVRQIALTVPVAIVAGFGWVSPALQAKWSAEHAGDLDLPGGQSAPYPCGDSTQGDTCVDPYNGPLGDLTRQKLAADWLAQMTRML